MDLRKHARGKPCRVRLSVRRQDTVAVSVDGGDGWGHLTERQALRLATELKEAVKAIRRRRRLLKRLFGDSLNIP